MVETWARPGRFRGSKRGIFTANQAPAFSCPLQRLQHSRREEFCGLGTPSFSYEHSELEKLALAERSEAGAPRRGPLAWLAAFGAQIGPPDRFAGFAGRASPLRDSARPH